MSSLSGLISPESHLNGKNFLGVVGCEDIFVIWVVGFLISHHHTELFDLLVSEIIKRIVMHPML